MKWIVIYAFLQMFMIPCPQVPLVADEFGRIYERTNFTLGACMESKETILNKSFNSKVEADAFVIRLEKESDLALIEVKVVNPKKKGKR